MGPRKHMTEEQKEILIAFMQKHGDFGAAFIQSPEGRKSKNELKEELATLLNSCTNGVVRSAKDWIRSWNDHKSKAKAKAAAIARHQRGTGGGPPADIPPLTPWEEKVISFMSPVLILGHDVREAGVEEMAASPSISTGPESIDMDLLEAGPSTSTIFIVESDPESRRESQPDAQTSGASTPSGTSTPESIPRRRKRRRVESTESEVDVLNRFVEAEQETNRGLMHLGERIAEGQQQIANAIISMGASIGDGMQAIATSQQALADSLAALASALANNQGKK